MSRALTEAQLPHFTLNANHDAAESAIVAKAGQAGCITVATNMAGRGTDIKLGSGVSALGGLHVIATELNDSARLDRQLAGRAGRQSDPGSFERILSLQDELVSRHVPMWLQCGYTHAVPSQHTRHGAGALDVSKLAIAI